VFLQNFLAALGAGGGQHPYPIFASLLRHACQRKLAIADCAAVLQVAKDQVGWDFRLKRVLLITEPLESPAE
jgi:hypothetical protein